MNFLRRIWYSLRHRRIEPVNALRHE